jgi:hypothetical protein
LGIKFRPGLFPAISKGLVFGIRGDGDEDEGKARVCKYEAEEECAFIKEYSKEKEGLIFSMFLP